MNFLELKVPPVALTLIFGAGMWIAATLTPDLAFDIPGREIAGTVIALIGLVIGIKAVVAFHRSGTTVNPLKPDTASRLLTSGVYRVSRNPMYLGLLLVLGGWAIALSNLIAVALLPAFVAYMTRFQIAVEERALQSTFDSEFLVYKKSVRRWL